MLERLLRQDEEQRAAGNASNRAQALAVNLGLQGPTDAHRFIFPYL